MNEWIAKLRKGDKVIVENRFNKKICTIGKVTSDGCLVIENMTFNQDGVQWDGTVRETLRLVQATNEIIEQVEHDTIIKEVLERMKKTDRISYEQAVKIKEILDDIDV